VFLALPPWFRIQPVQRLTLELSLLHCGEDNACDAAALLAVSGDNLRSPAGMSVTNSGERKVRTKERSTLKLKAPRRQLLKVIATTVQRTVAQKQQQMACQREQLMA